LTRKKEWVGHPRSATIKLPDLKEQSITLLITTLLACKYVKLIGKDFIKLTRSLVQEIAQLDRKGGSKMDKKYISKVSARYTEIMELDVMRGFNSRRSVSWND
jgi:hypothetical protein